MLTRVASSNFRLSSCHSPLVLSIWTKSSGRGQKIAGQGGASLVRRLFQGEMIYLTGGKGGAKAIVDIDHCDTIGA